MFFFFFLLITLSCMTILKTGSVNTIQKPKIKVNFWLKHKISEVGDLHSEIDPGPAGVQCLC